MKNILILAIAFAVTLTSYSQSLEYQNLALLFSQEDANGTARFTSMSGAFGALGGDVSSININPAGLAVFNNSAFSGSFNSRNSSISATYYGSSIDNQDQFFNLSQAGAVLVFDSAYNSDWNKFAIGFNYRMTTDFTDSFSASGNSGVPTFRDYPLDINRDTSLPTTDYNVAEEQLFLNDYVGEINEMNIAFSSVHQNKLYVGGGINFYDLSFSQRATLSEFNNDGNGNTLDTRLNQKNFISGTGISLNAGFIYKAHKSFRFGLAYQTPTWYTEMFQETNFDQYSAVNIGETIYVQNEGLPHTEFNDPFRFTYRLRTPSKLTSSAAFIFGKKGLLSIDYTNRNYRNLNYSDGDFASENQFFQDNLRRTHSINIGGEWRLDRFSLRGGYRFEQAPLKSAVNSDNLQGYSLGGGYNFGNFKLDFAYRDNNRTSFYNTYAQFPEVNSTELNINSRVFTTTFTINL